MEIKETEVRNTILEVNLTFDECYDLRIGKILECDLYDDVTLKISCQEAVKYFRGFNKEK